MLVAFSSLNFSRTPRVKVPGDLVSTALITCYGQTTTRMFRMFMHVQCLYRIYACVCAVSTSVLCMVLLHHHHHQQQQPAAATSSSNQQQQQYHYGRPSSPMYQSIDGPRGHDPLTFSSAPLLARSLPKMANCSDPPRPENNWCIFEVLKLSVPPASGLALTLSILHPNTKMVARLTLFA